MSSRPITGFEDRTPLNFRDSGSFCLHLISSSLSSIEGFRSLRSEACLLKLLWRRRLRNLPPPFRVVLYDQ
ncbi:hypothetical protein J5N97_013574 [Dioscorea zingiberensis]|uniref:Uncharacterized protein n=1 Tax=Dioscorea zingiberensis TaxID=325984 RepID=A0A9D5CTK0_9LILI|nr:hypothetical protein J5N97_013574 [Dioscorea zingiberensis]